MLAWAWQYLRIGKLSMHVSSVEPPLIKCGETHPFHSNDGRKWLNVSFAPLDYLNGLCDRVQCCELSQQGTFHGRISSKSPKSPLCGLSIQGHIYKHKICWLELSRLIFRKLAHSKYLIIWVPNTQEDVMKSESERTSYRICISIRIWEYYYHI